MSAGGGKTSQVIPVVFNIKYDCKIQTTIAKYKRQKHRHQISANCNFS